MPIDEVVLAAQAGDADAFATLYEKHRGRVLAQLRQLVRTDADAEELLQDVFLHIWKKIKQFKGKSAFGTWVYRVAYTTAMMKYRDMRATMRIPPELIDAYGIGHDDEMPTQYVSPRGTDPELHIDLVRAISKLAKGHRHALLDHDVFGYEHQEAAKMRGFSKGSSKSQTWKAREKVKEMLTCPTRF